MAAALSTTQTEASALRRAVVASGSQSALARIIGVTQGAVSKWLAEGKALPSQHVLTVEAATGVSRHDLRPDLYPRESVATAGGLEVAR